jgi:cysteine desulfurase
MTNFKLYHSDINLECAHSFVGDTCEWCGIKDADYAHCDICNGEAISAGAAVVSKSTSLGETIDMNVYMAISDALKAKADAKVTLECGARSAEFALADAVADANGLYKFTIALTSIQMADDVKVQVAGETSAVYTTSVKEYAEELIAEKQPDVRVNTPACRYAPHIMSLSLPGVRSETMLHFLSRSGVFVSSGSACSSNSGHKSHVLLSFGLPEKEADSTVRVSFGVQNTKDDVDNLVNSLAAGLSTLARRTKQR